MSIEPRGWIADSRRIKTPRSKSEYRQHLLPCHMKPIHDLVDAGSVLQVIKHNRHGVRVS